MDRRVRQINRRASRVALGSPAPSQADCAACVRARDCLLARAELRGHVAPTVERVVSAGTRIIHQGEPVHELVAIKIGLVLLRRRLASGEVCAVALVGPGLTLGVCALLSSAAEVDAVALTACRLCARAVRVQHQIPGVAVADSARLLEALADWATIGRLRTATQRVEETLRRIAHLQGAARVVLPPREVLGQLSACVPETVSRALATLVRRGRIRRGERRGVVYVLA
ncbi:Crp/Fnr family transcriptional regulator [Tepidimonas taiwanensis]|uniref:Cyclic nucleotide-binding domain protein n=1 Tax=Tepidimonas taiwanensis TaxID=307486 RepID=A0A554WYA3_9BURK|nr:Crp/Fnr family transcriptional regulator [Tepidimonas taiwanensis]TSE28538.1 Cyclic nucleotide-binding domain protein [Tepidimonas taiwanensis]UBQ05285.1 Crp/Fnr family transcriptional regulator [Tepidimonas taiwanensis]